jgi:hypothetical protein
MDYHHSIGHRDRDSTDVVTCVLKVAIPNEDHDKVTSHYSFLF